MDISRGCLDSLLTQHNRVDKSTKRLLLHFVRAVTIFGTFDGLHEDIVKRGLIFT
jgi:hypothetical protein